MWYLRTIAVYIVITFFLFLPAISASQYVVSPKKFEEKIASPQKTYVVFGADWCKPCVKLKKLLKDAGIAHKIVFLDAEKLWVAKILLKLEYHWIPFTVVYQNGKQTGVIRYGVGPSLIFLIANIETGKPVNEN